MSEERRGNSRKEVVGVAKVWVRGTDPSPCSRPDTETEMEELYNRASTAPQEPERCLDWGMPQEAVRSTAGVRPGGCSTAGGGAGKASLWSRPAAVPADGETGSRGGGMACWGVAWASCWHTSATGGEGSPHDVGAGHSNGCPHRLRNLRGPATPTRRHRIRPERCSSVKALVPRGAWCAPP